MLLSCGRQRERVPHVPDESHLEAVFPLDNHPAAPVGQELLLQRLPARLSGLHHRDGADRALEPCQTRQKARETPGDIISDAGAGGGRGGVWSLERHASQALEAAQVLDLTQVSEAMIQAHVADGVADRHLAHGLDGGGPLKRFVV